MITAYASSEHSFLDEAASAVAEWRQKNMPYSFLDNKPAPPRSAHVPNLEGDH